MGTYSINKYLEAAHENCFENGAAIKKRIQPCGCFFCGRIYSSEDFSPMSFNTEFSGKETAFCPFCGVDAVLCEDSGFPITKDFLTAMHRKYFFF